MPVSVNSASETSNAPAHLAKYSAAAGAEKAAILDAIPGTHCDMQIIDALATIGMTLEEWHVLGVKRAMEKCGGRTN